MAYLRRLFSALGVVVIALLCIVTIVMAAPGDVTFNFAYATDTTVILTWTPAPLSTSTVIRYSTDFFPATPTSNVSAYNGSGFECTVSGLTAGQTYYFSAWGYDGALYSTNPAHTQITTYAVPLSSGAPESYPVVVTIPTIPSTANATANTTGFRLEPFSSIVRYFVTGNVTGGSGVTPSGGGLGMPINNTAEAIAIGVIVAGGIGSYTKSRNFFIAYFVVFILTCIFVGLKLVQLYLPAIEIVVGLGVWALERYFQ